jgi:hypothetical protein
MGIFGKIGPTLINGVLRAFKVNVKEETEPEDINDATAKAIKIFTRAVILVSLYKFFPDMFEKFFTIIFAG